MKKSMKQQLSVLLCTFFVTTSLYAQDINLGQVFNQVKHTAEKVKDVASVAAQVGKEEGGHFAQEVNALWSDFSKKVKQASEKAGEKIKVVTKNLRVKMQESFLKMTNRFKTDKQIILGMGPEKVAGEHDMIELLVAFEKPKNCELLLEQMQELEQALGCSDKSKDVLYQIAELTYRTVRGVFCKSVVSEFSINFLKQEGNAASEVNKIENAEKTVLHLYIQGNDDVVAWTGLVERFMNIARMLDTVQEEQNEESYYHILDAISLVINDAIDCNCTLHMYVLSNILQEQEDVLSVEIV